MLDLVEGTAPRPPGAPAGLLISLAMEVLARDGSVWLREATPSMGPLIRPGDEVRLVPTDGRRVRRGALIAYRGQERLILHRVLSRTEAGVVTKGDALASPDPLVRWQEVVARAVGLRRAGRRPADLDAFPWPAINHALGVIAAIASRLPVERRGAGRRPWWPRLVWKSLRLPFHLARLLVP